MSTWLGRNWKPFAALGVVNAVIAVDGVIIEHTAPVSIGWFMVLANVTLAGAVAVVGLIGAWLVGMERS